MIRAILHSLRMLDPMKAARRRVWSRLLRSFLAQCEHDGVRARWLATHDPVRLAAFDFAVRRLKRDGVPGHFAEVGVFRGDLSVFLQELDPTRWLYLFDTFEGFPEADLEGGRDARFQDTDEKDVLARLPCSGRAVVRKGYFPDTFSGLEDETFALVVLDVDLFAPTKAGLELFYPRLQRGGYLFLHDYNSPESNRGVARAADAFMSDKRERLVDLPDAYGTVLFRRV